ncbi:MAG: hypothetical protein ACFFDK_10095 [Promethearchaeota archaeon]
MSSNIKKKFKLLFILGLILLFASLFLEWYVLQVYNSSHTLIAYWSYNPLTGWSTIFSEGSTFNNIVKPEEIQMPLVLTGLFMVVLVISAFSAIFKDLESQGDLEKLYPYAYVNLFLIALNLYYIFAFPVFYLLPHKLYFPFLLVKDREMDVVYHYSIGAGYILQIIGFIMIFPYCTFYYNTIVRFISKEQSPDKIIKRYVQYIQENLDLDKLIANEELKLKFVDKPLDIKEDFEFNYKKAHKKRGVKP